MEQANFLKQFNPTSLEMVAAVEARQNAEQAASELAGAPKIYPPQAVSPADGAKRPKGLDPEKDAAETARIARMEAEAKRIDARYIAEQAAASRRTEFILAEMLAVISADKLSDIYHGKNVDAGGLLEVETMVSDLLRDKEFTGEIYDKKLEAIGDKILGCIFHSYHDVFTEVRQESLTALKLNGLVEMLTGMFSDLD